MPIRQIAGIMLAHRCGSAFLNLKTQEAESLRFFISGSLKQSHMNPKGDAMAASSRLAMGVATVLLLPMCVFVAAGLQGELKPLADQVRTVVQKHYPKATVEITKDPIAEAKQIVVSFNTRKYWIHNPTLDGHWQDAHEEIGPQRGGVYATLQLRDGRYGGQAMVPQNFNKRYFVLRVMAPYSKRLDQHLYVHFKFANDASKEFKADIEKLVNDFGEQ